MDYKISDLITAYFSLPKSKEGVFRTIQDIQAVIRGFTGIVVDPAELEKELTTAGFEPAKRILRSGAAQRGNRKQVEEVSKKGFIVNII